jgi:hypothetical protein
MTNLRPQKLSTFLATLAITAFVAANAAHAFTIDTQSGSNADGSAKYVDPDEQFANFASGKNTFSLGSGFLNFDFRPFFGADQRGPQVSPSYPQYRALPDH